MSSTFSKKPKSSKPLPLNESPLNSSLKSKRLNGINQEIKSQPGKNKKQYAEKLLQSANFELETKIQNIIQSFIQKDKSILKEGSMQLLENLNKFFLKSSQENFNIDKSLNEVKENISNPQISEMQQRIRELECYKLDYEDKISRHATYIVELEQKVGLLIEEYEKCLTMNEKLTTKLENSRYDTSILNHSIEKIEESLNRTEREKCNEMTADSQGNIQSYKESILKLEAELKDAQSIKEDNKKLTQEIENLKSQLSNAENQIKDLNGTASLLEHLKEENTFLQQDIQEKNTVIQSLKTQTPMQEQETDKDSISKLEYDTMKSQLEDFKTLNKNLQKEATEYCLQIDSLTQTLREVNKGLDLAQTKCAALEKDLLGKNQFEEKIASLLENINILAAKIEELAQENTRLQTLNEDHLMLISSLRNQLDEKNAVTQAGSLCLEDLKDRLNDQRGEVDPPQGKEFSPSAIETHRESQDTFGQALRARENEFDEERINYRLQIEQYNSNLDMLVGKIQILIKINENLTREIEHLKYEHANHRTAVWSTFQESKKHLEIIKVWDKELEDYFSTKCDNIAGDFNTVLNTYYQVRREAMSIDYLLEDKRAYI